MSSSFPAKPSSARSTRISPSGKVWVEDAQGLPPTIPFWLGEAPPRTRELSKAVSDLRRDVAERSADRAAARLWIIDEIIIPEAAADQIVNYVADTHAMLGAVPTQDHIIAERFLTKPAECSW